MFNFTGYLRGKFGIATQAIEEQFNERLNWILFLLDLDGTITKAQIAQILGKLESTIEKDSEN